MKGPNWIEQHGGRRPDACLKKKKEKEKFARLSNSRGKLFYPWIWPCSSVMSTLQEMQEILYTLTWVETLNGPCVSVNGVCVLDLPVQGVCWTRMRYKCFCCLVFQFYLLNFVKSVPDADFSCIFGCIQTYEKGKIKENILQPTDGESPSAPIGLLLEREEGWRKRRRGTRIKRLKNG